MQNFEYSVRKATAFPEQQELSSGEGCPHPQNPPIRRKFMTLRHESSRKWQSSKRLRSLFEQLDPRGGQLIPDFCQIR